MTDVRTNKTTPTAGYDPTALRDVVNNRSRELGLTRDRLAQAAGVGRSTLFDWLAGTGQPSPAGWSRLAQALEMPVSDLAAAAGVAPQTLTARARLERGWTRGELAEAAQVSYATVRMLESGKPVRADAAARVAAALGISEAARGGMARVAMRATTPLGRVLEAERLRRGWTIADLARHVGAARQLVSAWMLGTEPVAARWLPALAGFTGKDLAELDVLAQESRPQRAGAAAGAKLKAARLRQDLTVSDVAGQVGVRESTVKEWETGYRSPGERSRARLSHLLGPDHEHAQECGI